MTGEIRKADSRILTPVTLAVLPEENQVEQEAPNLRDLLFPLHISGAGCVSDDLVSVYTLPPLSLHSICMISYYLV